MPLGRTGRRLSFERRLFLWLCLLALPAVVFGGWLMVDARASVTAMVSAAVVFVLAWLLAASSLMELITRPMQTLANVVAALREDDFSFRARGARRGDALGDLALEINALAGTLQAQRSSALEALTLVERVMSSMQSPVLAFDAQGRLRLHNVAADQAFGLTRPASDGRSAEELGLRVLLDVRDEGLYLDTSKAKDVTRYVVRRAAFRLRGVPHVLLVLSDVGAALREEERLAWRRLIRVLGHEINNSLTPIKSIAGSLRGRLPESVEGAPNLSRDLQRGLAVIEDRAASLNRFLQAYQQLSTLPAPRLEWVALRLVIERVALLEQRIAVRIEVGPEVVLRVDSDQIQQAFINLLQNAVDASLEAAEQEGGAAEVSVVWTVDESQAVVRITDNGLGLANPVNLFVPFYTTKPKGTGIGLALAQQIVIVHKGSVSLANREDGRGCVAEVRLPLRG